MREGGKNFVFEINQHSFEIEINEAIFLLLLLLNKNLEY
jgi:hypothetical protein